MTVDNTSVHCGSSCATHYLIFSVFTFLCGRTFPGFSTWAEMRGFCKPAPFTTFSAYPQLHPWEILPAAGAADFWVTLQFACNYLPPSRTLGATATSHGSTATSRAVAAARLPRPQCPREPVRRELPAVILWDTVTLPVSAAPRLCRRVAAVAAVRAALPFHRVSPRGEGAAAPGSVRRQQWCLAAREAHPPAGCCAPGLRLHQMYN